MLYNRGVAMLSKQYRTVSDVLTDKLTLIVEKLCLSNNLCVIDFSVKLISKFEVHIKYDIILHDFILANNNMTLNIIIKQEQYLENRTEYSRYMILALIAMIFYKREQSFITSYYRQFSVDIKISRSPGLAKLFFLLFVEICLLYDGIHAFSV